MNSKILFRDFFSLILICVSMHMLIADGKAKDEPTCLFKPVFHIREITDVAKSPVGNTLALINISGQGYIWNAETNTFVVSLASRATSAAPVWSSTGDRLATHSADEVSLWNSQTGELLFTFTAYPVDIVDEIFSENISGISDKRFSSDGTMLATADTYDRTVFVYDTATGAVMYELGDHSDGVQRLAFSPNDSILATASMWSNVVTLWNTETGQRLEELGETAETIAFSPDGLMLATGSHIINGIASLDRSFVSIWNVENRQKVMDFEAPLIINDLRWMPNNNVIFAQFSSQVLPSEGSPYFEAALRGWSILTGQPQYVFDMRPDEISAFAWSTNMKLLAAGTLSGSITIWDLKTKNTLCSFEDVSAILQLFWLDDDTGFITLGRNRTLTIWR